MKKTLSRLVFLLVTAIMPAALSAADGKPFVIPELKEWKAAGGTFTPTGNSRAVYPKGDTELAKTAAAFAEDYHTMFGIRIKTAEGKARPGDFVFATAPDNSKKLGKEGYRINISDQITITAPEPVGAYWATRTLLQMSEQNDERSLPKGEITDWPDYELRGLMLDCARKFVPIHFLRDYVKIMAYYKMNAFQIHLNDNGFPRFFEWNWDKTYAAFRLESEKYPGLTAQDGSYSKKEFVDLQKLAEERYVEIIPEIDAPAHSLAFSHYKPEIGSEEYGMDHLDLFNPETYAFIDGLFEEYLGGDEPVFRGKRVHIGTDEYSNKKKDVVEKFRYFTDHYIRYVESFGKQACIWGALTHARGETPVKSENVLMLAWHNPYAQPDSMKQLGYDLVSIPDGLMYIVPNAGYYYNYLNTKRLYESWTPAHIGNKVFEERDPQILGGMFALWNDHVGNGISTKDLHDRMMPAIQTLAVKMWTGKQTELPYNDFDRLRKTMSEAPGVNVAGRIGREPALVYEVADVRPKSKGKHTEIGYNYTVTFDVTGVDEKRGTVLFSSPDTEFYLSDPVKGLLGFSRDGYLYTFNYSVKEGEKANIKVCGDSKGTRMYLNGKLRDDLSIRKVWYNDGKNALKCISTLVFPLGQAGDFKSSVTNLKVYNYCDE